MAKHILGKKGSHIMLYTLSTCPWCQKVKQMLSESGFEYYYEDVDLLTGNAKHDVMSDVERWNPKRSFPTVVVDNSRCIIGYQESALRCLLSS
jgi:glutaredoxin